MQCNRNKLAKIIEHDVKTIDRMVDKGMPYLSRPDTKVGETRWLFETADVLAWMSGNKLAARVKEAKTRIAKAKAGLKWLEYGKQLGFLVEIDDIMRHIERGDAIVKSRLTAIPGRLAQLVAVEADPDVVKLILEKEFEDALDQLNKDWKDRG